MPSEDVYKRQSREWKAIKPDGSLVEPGTAGTLKFNGSAAGNANETAASIGNPILDTKRDKPSYTGGETDAYYAYLYQPLESVAAASGVTAVSYTHLDVYKRQW